MFIETKDGVIIEAINVRFHKTKRIVYFRCIDKMEQCLFTNQVTEIRDTPLSEHLFHPTDEPYNHATRR